MLFDCFGINDVACNRRLVSEGFREILFYAVRFILWNIAFLKELSDNSLVKQELFIGIFVNNLIFFNHVSQVLLDIDKQVFRVLILGTENVTDNGMKCHFLFGCGTCRVTAEAVCHKFRMRLLGIFCVE